MGRNIKYNNDIDRQRAITESKTKYMLNKPWFCDICDNKKNYTLAGKWMHIKSKKHIKNTIINDLDRDYMINIVNNT